jgi:hypothetical protein
MNPDIFVLLVSNILLIQIIFLFRRNLRISINTLVASLYVLVIMSFNYTLITGDKQYVEIPHAFGNVLVLITTIFMNDTRILSINAVLLLLTVVSRIYYNACAINLTKDKKNMSIVNALNHIENEIEKYTSIRLNWAHMYYVMLFINLYKLYYSN